MIEFLIEGIASFIGGYFSQKASENKISIVKFFFIIFITLLAVSVFIQLLIDRISLNELIFGLIVSLSGAVICSLILIIWLKIKKNKNKP